MSAEYTWRDGFRSNKTDATKAAAELEKIRAKHGTLDAQAVVDFAKSRKRSELHKAFDWDVESIANKWWLHRAQDLIGAVREVKITGGDVKVTRSNYSVGGGVFVTSKEVRQNVDYQTIIMERAVSSLEGWRDRYSEIVNLCGASDPLEDALNILRSSLAEKAAE